MTKNLEDIKVLIKLKFLDSNAEYLENILNKEVDIAIFKRALSKLLHNSSINFEDNNAISEEGFLLIAASLLGYEINKDYNKSNIIDFVKEKGLSPINSKIYSNADFFSNLLDLLKAKTKDNVDYFEVICKNGVFKDFNENKDIPEILVFNGKTQPIFDYKEAIFEKVYVETPLDTDNDNKRDLIAAFIRRPKETNAGMKVPVIYIASPYMMRCNEDLYNLHNVDCDLEVIEETNIEYNDIQYNEVKKELPKPREVLGKTTASLTEEIEFDAITPWYKYFITRGYAVVLAGGIGTLDSEGVRFCGSTEETISTISVIDWLNNRLKAFSNKTDNLEVVADWCNGNVGMTGKSYLGTLAIAAATTGVEGLKTIVPEAAISNWYDYYRCNGLTVSALGWQGDDADLLAEYCFSRRLDPKDYENIKDYFDKVLNEIKINQDRKTGNYNRFWDERNYLKNAQNIKASVFIVHGLSDWNVKPKQFHMLWNELEKYNIPRKMMLHQGDHIYINNLRSIDFSDIMNKWYGYWLYDIDNGIMENLPNVLIQNNTDVSCWDESSCWPFDGVKGIKLFVGNDNKLTTIKSEYNEAVPLKDDLSLTGYNREEQNENLWLNSVANNPELHKPYRLSYVTDLLSEDIRISGVVNVQLKANLNNSKTGILSAMIVDYGTSFVPTLELQKVKDDGIIYGINAGTDDLVDFVIGDTPKEFNVITRGWMNVQNRRNNFNKDDVVLNEYYTFTFDLVPIDYTILKGHKLGVVIYSTDVQATQRQLKVTDFTIQKDSITITIPMKKY